MSSVNLNFYANSLHFRTEVRVALPEYPDQRNPDVPRNQAFDPTRKFPVVYLLHGFTGDYSDWSAMLPIENFANKYGMALVMPHGYNTWYLNISEQMQMETYIAEELPAAMEAMLPISSLPENRFIAGLSMGGTGAMRIAWKYPERYRAVASMSGLPDLTLPLGEPEDRAAYEALVAGSISDCLSSASAFSQSETSIPAIAADAVEKGIKLPPLLFMYGRQDPRFDIQFHSFRQFAEKHHLPVRFSTAEGNHDFGYWEPSSREFLSWFHELSYSH